eukprot:GHVL01021194.1.p1 GENE.GHVL01021194.1~~GHVL01021194.1.p1  ORF type:complete len:593 (+),score=65.52 GHVL01021194.1:80-1858(+)
MRNSHTFLIILSSLVALAAATSIPQYACTFIEFECSLDYSTNYPSANGTPGPLDAAIITKEPCGYLSSSATILGHNHINQSSLKFEFFDQTHRDVGYYFVCWCDSTEPGADCFRQIENQAMNNNFKLLIGTLLRTPPLFPLRLDCTSGRCSHMDHYPGIHENDAAVIVEASDCQNIQSDTIRTGPVQVRNIAFDFTNVSDFFQLSGSLCWCYDCYTPYVTDFSLFNTKIAYIDGPRGWSIPPTAIDAVCKQGETDFALTFTANDYPDPNAGDSAIISSVPCGRSTTIGEKIGYVVVDVHNRSFTFTSQNEQPVGDFYVCWCDGTNNLRDCSDPQDATAINGYFTSTISNLLRIPGSNYYQLDCTSGSCSQTIDYTGLTANDAAIIVEASDCQNIQQNDVKSGPVQIANSAFDFTTVGDFSQVTGSLCCCFNCYNENMTTFSSFKTKIVKVYGPSSSLTTPSIPPAIRSDICRQGETDCVLTFTADDYPTPNAVDSAIISSVPCGRSTTIGEKIGYVVVDVHNRSFTFTSQNEQPVGDFYVCWCDGSTNLRDCSDPQDIKGINSNFPITIIQLSREYVNNRILSSTVVKNLLH